MKILWVNSLLLIFGFGLSNLHVIYSFPKDGSLTIHNGYVVQPHSIPFQALLMIYSEGYPALCGGSLISEEYVLTAAHCVKGGDYAEVYLGVHNRSELDENVQLFNSTELHFHKDYGYNDSRPINDIGLIKLPHPVKVTSAVQIGKIISSEDYQANPNQVGINATVSGWGKFGPGLTGGFSDVLRAGLLHVVDPTFCYEATPPTYTPDEFLCIQLLSQKEPESGSGDSGGPLFKNTTDGQIIVGLVSHGAHVFEADTNVGYYLDWISNYTKVVY